MSYFIAFFTSRKMKHSLLGGLVWGCKVFLKKNFAIYSLVSRNWALKKVSIVIN